MLKKRVGINPLNTSSMNQEYPGQGEGRHEQQRWREQKAGLGRAAENEFANEARGTELRAKVIRLEGDIAARRASIEALVTQMQAGEKIVVGNTELAAIKKELHEEAYAQKLKLLGEVEQLEKERRAAEDELTSL